MDTPACCTADHCTRELRDWELDAHMVICSPCLGQMRGWLQQIPAALVVLRDGSMQRERTGTGGRCGTRTPPLPGRLDTLNLVGPAASGTVHDPHGDQTGTQPITGVLGSWVRLIGEERRIDGPEQWTEEALAGWLLRQLGWAATQPYAAELASELRDLMWAIRGITRIRPQTRPVPRPCPREHCAQLTLTQTDGDLYIRCGACGNAYTQAELNDDAARRAAAA